MRVAWLLVLAALPATAWATEPSVVLLDWREGASLLGGPVPVDGVNARAFPLVVDACHRRVLVDVLYAPEETLLVDAPAAEVALPHVFRADVLQGATVVASGSVRASGYGWSLGVVPAGEYALRLHLTQGADVSWTLRARGWEVPGEADCLPRVVVSEVELDPPGPDDGRDWVELLNLHDAPVDLWGWTVAGASAEVTLPEGSVLAPGARLVVAFPEAGLDGAGEEVELRLLGLVRDRTPPLADAADDERTWQRGDPWAFAPGTPGE